MSQENRKRRGLHLKWVIWVLAALFYFFEYVLRVSPSVMVNTLMDAFSVNALQIGILSAFFLYAYAPMQLPVGLLIDRYGLKKNLTFACMISGLGAFLFGFAPDLAIAALGRFLVGGGASFAFVAMIFITSHWFPKSKRALLVGMANSIAMLGAAFGGGPLASVIEAIGWRFAILILGILGVILGVSIYWMLSVDSDDESIEEKASHKPVRLWPHLKTVLKNRSGWVNAIIAICFYITTTAFAGLWGVPFIEVAHGVSKTTAAFSMSMVFIGWLIGGPIIGYLSDQVEKKTPLIRISMLIVALCLSILIFSSNLPVWLVFTLALAIGIFSSAELLNFGIAIDINPIYVKATAVAFTNFMVSIGDGISQSIIGFFLDLGWDGKVVDGIPFYTLGDYQHALMILPIALFLGFSLTFLLKE